MDIKPIYIYKVKTPNNDRRYFILKDNFDVNIQVICLIPFLLYICVKVNTEYKISNNDSISCIIYDTGLDLLPFDSTNISLITFDDLSYLINRINSPWHNYSNKWEGLLLLLQLILAKWEDWY